jgi:predicted nucleic acid-binding Zn finger protein
MWILARYRDITYSAAMQATSYDRMSVLVRSATRQGIVHLIDFEGHERDKIVCTCEAFILGGDKRCKHIRALTVPMPI